MENRQGEGKNSVGNVEAKPMDMNYRGECGREGVGRMEWSGGGKWDNCNSIINIYIKKSDQFLYVAVGITKYKATITESSLRQQYLSKMCRTLATQSDPWTVSFLGAYQKY